MHIHRSAHARNFTVLPNFMLQDRRLTFDSRGLLVDLLSRPEGWREDARQIAASSPQGRARICRALRELTAAGYYRVEKVRMPDGTIRTETHVYDTPQLPPPPGATRPGPGEAAPRLPDALSKNRFKEPTLPAEPIAEPVAESVAEPVAVAEPRGAVPDEQVREAVAALFRAIRPEPRLRLGEAEAHGLAPLVAQWLERGSTPADLAHALLPGLPVPMHSPVAVLRDRLKRKMPPVPAPARPPGARYAECAECHDPLPEPGICRPCAGLGGRAVQVGGGAAVAAAGAARVRAAVLAARSALHVGHPVPAGAG